MKDIWKKKSFWITVGLVIIFVSIIVLSNRNVDGSKGGKLVGPSHAQGGIKGIIKTNGGKLELEGNENVIAANANRIPYYYECRGTLGGISSAVNVEAGGIQFDKNGICNRIN